MLKKVNSLLALLLTFLLAISMCSMGAFASAEENGADITFSFLRANRDNYIADNYGYNGNFESYLQPRGSVSFKVTAKEAGYYRLNLTGYSTGNDVTVTVNDEVVMDRVIFAKNEEDAATKFTDEIINGNVFLNAGENNVTCTLVNGFLGNMTFTKTDVTHKVTFSEANKTAGVFTDSNGDGNFGNANFRYFYQPGAGSTLSFTVNAQEEGYYKVLASGVSTGDSYTLTVNDVTVANAVKCDTTMEVYWNQLIDDFLYLKKGDNTVTYTVSSNGLVEGLMFAKVDTDNFEFSYLRDNNLNYTFGGNNSLPDGYLHPGANDEVVFKFYAPEAGYYRTAFTGYVNYSQEAWTLTVNGEVVTDRMKMRDSAGVYYATGTAVTDYILNGCVYMNKGENTVGLKTDNNGFFKSLKLIKQENVKAKFRFTSANKTAGLFTDSTTDGNFGQSSFGYLYQPGANSTLSFSVNVPEAGYYKITASGNYQSDSTSVTVNGVTVRDAQKYPATNSTYYWDALVNNCVYLNNGANDITYTISGSGFVEGLVFEKITSDVEFSFLKTNEANFTSATKSYLASYNYYLQPGANKEVSFKINAPFAGYYKMDMTGWSTGDNYTVKIDSDYSKTFKPISTMAEFEDFVADGKVYLAKGEHDVVCSVSGSGMLGSISFTIADKDDFIISDIILADENGDSLTNLDGKVFAKMTITQHDENADSSGIYFITATYSGNKLINVTKDLLSFAEVDVEAEVDKEIVLEDGVDKVKAFLWEFDANGSFAPMTDCTQFPENVQQ